MILVAGATGYAGSAVVRRLLSEGLEVAAMVRDAGAAGERLPPQVTLRVADYEDISALRSALAGADQMILISSDGEARAVMRHHANIISAATAASLRHITFTSVIDDAALRGEVRCPMLGTGFPALRIHFDVAEGSGKRVRA